MKSLIKWLKIITISIVAFILLTLLAGFCHEQFMRYQARKEFKMVGKLVNIGQHQLNYLALGKGKPEVVFESGLDGGGFLTWSKVQPEIAKFATTISYNRAGFLWSEGGNNPKSCEAMADELYLLLKKTNHNGPYILVGHSLAGYILRSFISKHPTEVAGIIFVDVAHPNQNNDIKLPPICILNFLNSVGYLRYINSKDFQYPNTSFNDKFNTIARAFAHKSTAAAFEEYHQVKQLAKEADKINTFGKVPLYILTAANKPKHLKYESDSEFNTHLNYQKSLLNLSGNSKQILAENSDHCIQFDEPTLVIESIRKLIDQNNIKYSSKLFNQ
jgi:pimeloyl-ACP methyl ester carboxylesterase